MKCVLQNLCSPQRVSSWCGDQCLRYLQICSMGLWSAQESKQVAADLARLWVCPIWDPAKENGDRPVRPL